MKRLAILFLALLPAFCIGQVLPCIDGDAGALRAEVLNNSVILHNDTACRNCGTLYSMEITSLGNHQLSWLQRDTGQAAYCLCNFNLSVTVDSLEAGIYTTSVYYTAAETDETVYVGAVSFEIIDSGPYHSPSVLNQYQSPCIITGIPSPGRSSDRLQLIYPNPADGTINIESDEGGKIFILTSDGRQLRFAESTGTTATIDVSILPPGVYLVKVAGEKRVQFGKFFKK